MIGLPIISLWQPWAQWVALGWKTCETRLHDRFKGLLGKRIGIHTSLKWDKDALTLAARYLSKEQRDRTKNFLRVGGAIVCTTTVKEARWLKGSNYYDDASPTQDEIAALIECETARYGLFLTDTEIIEAIPARGKQGIWYLGRQP